jgi:hypothetical protein
MIVDVFNGKEPMNRAFALRMHSHFVRKRTTVISLTVVYVLNWNCGIVEMNGYRGDRN